MSGAKNTKPENGKTSSSDEAGGAQVPLEFVCHDPENRDQPCPICFGRGVYTLDVPLADVRYGKFQRCPNFPVEVDRNMQERLRRFGNLQAFRDKTFEGFRIEQTGGSYTQNVISSLERAKNLAQLFAQNPSGWRIFEGPFGCGKTHLAVAIANTRLEQYGEQVIFTTAPDLLDFLRMTYSPTADASYDEYFERIRNVTLLVLDDLGTENPSAWAKEKLFQLLNYRHVNRLPTVITTNTPFDDLDPRLSSRMMDREVVQHVKINAPDYRRTARSQSLDLRFSNMELYGQMTFERFSVDSLLFEETAKLRKAKNSSRRVGE